jgi:hypothetical protein
MPHARIGSFASLAIVAFAGLAGAGAVVATGCSSFGTDPVEDAKDGAPLDDAARDAAEPLADAGPDAPPPPCDLTKPFGTPVNVVLPELAGRRVFRVSADELSVLFQATGTAKLDTYSAARPSRDFPFADITALNALNSGANDGNAVLTFDGSAVFFTSDRNSASSGADNFDLFYAPRVGGQLDAPVALNALDSASNETEPYPRRDGKELWFTSDRDNGAGVDALWVATSTMPGAFTAYHAAASLNTGKGEGHAVLSADGLTIYFATLRKGSSWDVWTATRSDLDADFGAPASFDLASSPDFDERPSGVSADGCRVYFERTPITAGESELLVVARQR